MCYLSLFGLFFYLTIAHAAASAARLRVAANCFWCRICRRLIIQPDNICRNSRGFDDSGQSECRPACGGLQRRCDAKQAATSASDGSGMRRRRQRIFCPFFPLCLRNSFSSWEEG